MANMDSLLRKAEPGSLHGASADEPYRTGVIAFFRDFDSLEESFDHVLNEFDHVAVTQPELTEVTVAHLT